MMIRIGTRDSQLALWQANTVKNLLHALGIEAKLVPIKSDGDTDLITPLYAMGVQGVFTKTLDAALLSNHIDIAVHSMKDVPVQLAKGLHEAAVLERANYKDILVYKKGVVNTFPTDIYATTFFDKNFTGTIATSSIRRRAQWLHYFPNTNIENLRGNVNTRLQKLDNNNWQGAIFAAAGLERIQLRPSHSIDLNWMLPAPAQGAVVVVCRVNDEQIRHHLSYINHSQTAMCTKAERDFLQTLQGGCSAPISALATIDAGIITLNGNIFSPDGKEKKEIKLQSPIQESDTIGKIAGESLLNNGADKLVRTINKPL